MVQILTNDNIDSLVLDNEFHMIYEDLNYKFTKNDIKNYLRMYRLEYCYDDVVTLNSRVVFEFSMNGSNYARLINAFELNYSPIENYDKYSEIKTNEVENVTSDNTMNNNTNSSTNDNSLTSNHARTIENTEFVNNNKVENTSSNNNETITSMISNNETDKTNDVETVEHTHGNIGVTKMSELVNDEISLRMNNVRIMILNNIFDKFLYFVE